MGVNELMDVKQFFRFEGQITEKQHKEMWVNSTHDSFEFLR